MTDVLIALPFSFWVALVLLAAGFFIALQRIRDGIAFPMLAVFATVGAWYVGDILYNNYKETHAEQFTIGVLSDAWWQVALFLISFLVITPRLYAYINRRNPNQKSYVYMMLKLGVDNKIFQEQLELLFYGSTVVWALLTITATYRLEAGVLYYFFPFLGEKMSPWDRGRIGEGLDALLAFAAYLQIFVAGVFGIIAALSKKRWIMGLAVIGCILTWPYYLFDRTRNTLLAAIIPAVLTWVFLRFRGRLLYKVLIILAFYGLIEAWMSYIIVNRTTTTIAKAYREKGFRLEEAGGAHHNGLNMYEELCWINTFLGDGSYKPNWGERYFADLVNPIPRALWPEKPMIGIDYAIARGQLGGDDKQGGVFATISTGVIGQGVVNFGPLLGPPFAAFLMAIWAVILGRLDISGHQMGHIPLYALGLILTSNLGRDVTFITVYSFIFGAMLIWALRRLNYKNRPPRAVRMKQPVSFRYAARR